MLPQAAPQPAEEPADEWLTADEVAARLKITVRTVDRYRAEGLITAYGLGPRLKRFSAREIDALMRPVMSGGERHAS